MQSVFCGFVFGTTSRVRKTYFVLKTRPWSLWNRPNDSTTPWFELQFYGCENFGANHFFYNVRGLVTAQRTDECDFDRFFLGSNAKTYFFSKYGLWLVNYRRSRRLIDLLSYSNFCSKNGPKTNQWNNRALNNDRSGSKNETRAKLMRDTESPFDDCAGYWWQ